MKADFSRNFRLVAATTLAAVWAYSHLARTPWLGDTVAPLVIALLIAPGVNWRLRGSQLLLALLALVVITALLFWAGSDAALDAFSHSPWFVLPLWALTMFGLVRNAVSAERSAALAKDAPAPASAPDAG